MKQLLVVKDGTPYAAKIGGSTIADFTEVNLLAEGAIAYFTKATNGTYTMLSATFTGLAFTGTLEALTGNSQNYTPAGTISIGQVTGDVILAVGSGDSTIGATITKPLGRGSVCQVEEYIAPQKQVSLVGKGTGTAGSITIPTADLVVGKVFSIEIQDLSEPMFARLNIIKGERYDYVLKSADITNSATAVTAILNGWIASINATSKKYTASIAEGTTTGIEIAANDYNQKFKVLCYDGAINFVVQEGDGTTNTVDGHALSMIVGNGLATQVATLEAAISVEDGNTNQMTATALNVYKKASKVVAGETYDMYSIVSTNRYSTAFGSDNGVETLVLVAVPDGFTASSGAFTEATIQADFMTVGLFNNNKSLI